MVDALVQADESAWISVCCAEVEPPDPLLHPTTGTTDTIRTPNDADKNARSMHPG
jgi:hypothetical protein